MQALTNWLTVLVAVVAAGFVYVQIRQAHSQTAINTARDFVARSRELWADCISEVNGGEGGFDVERFRFCVAQLIAHFEINVICLTEIDLPDRVYDMIDRTIVDYLNEMVSAGYTPYMREILQRKLVCPCLKGFCMQRLSLFEDKTALMGALGIESYRWR